MQVRKIRDVLQAELLCGDLDMEVHSACGSDMMSDVLAFVKEQGMMLTGLVNLQTIRTAEMMDMKCIAFVRGKTPAPDMIGLAREHGITLLSTRLTMFTACGRLYEAGLRGGNE